MPRPTKRDLAILLLIGSLTVAAGVLALLDMTRLALVCVGLLVGGAAVVAYIQFIARRSTYRLLRRESRATREATKRSLRMASLLRNELEKMKEDVELTQATAERTSHLMSSGLAMGDKGLSVLERLVETTGADGKALRTDIAILGTELTAQAGWKALRSEISAIANESAALRTGISALASESTADAGWNTLRSEISALANESAALRSEISALATESTAEAVGKALRSAISALAAESAALRSELRGVRVSQQLFAQSVAVLRQAGVEDSAKVDDLSAEVVGLSTKVNDLSSQMGEEAAQLRELVALGTATDPMLASADESGGMASGSTDESRAAISALEWQIRRQRPELVTDFQALYQLLQRFTPSARLPIIGGWAMSPAGLLMLTDTIGKRAAELVVECGSGTSTLWMAYAMRAQGKGKVVAIEHLQEYADRTQELLNEHGVAPWAEVRVAPLTTIETPEGQFLWYDTVGMSWEREIDILLVDGPPTTTGTHARYPALPVLGDLLSPTALIVVDDADRQDEQEVMRLWKAAWPDLVRLPSPGPGVELLTRNAEA